MTAAPPSPSSSLLRDTPRAGKQSDLRPVGCAQRSFRDITEHEDVGPNTWPGHRRIWGVTPDRRASVDESAQRPIDGHRPSSQAAAEELLGDDGRVVEACRLLPVGSDTPPLNRLAELAAALLKARESHISLLADVEVVSAGSGLPPGTVGSESPLHTSVCSVLNATGGGDRLGDRLGTPLVAGTGQVVGALCVHGSEPRAWSDTDVSTLKQLAEAVVTELELSAVVRRYENDRVRWDLAIDAAGVGTF